MHILLWMLVKQLENLQYNVLRLVNVSDHVIESKYIKYITLKKRQYLFFFFKFQFENACIINKSL